MLRPGSASATPGWLRAASCSAAPGGRALLHQTREDLQHRNVESVRDVLRLPPGVRIRRLVDGGGYVLFEPSPLPGGGEWLRPLLLWGSSIRGKVDEPFVGSLRGTAVHTRTGRPWSGRVNVRAYGVVSVELQM